mgnify:CR=1 FL=1
MNYLNDNHSDLDLKCDFPARESFQDGLLARLLDADRQARELTQLEDDSEARELSDSELELLAAAQGDIYQYKTLL